MNLERALQNEQILNEIGKAGKEVAVNSFNSEVQGKRLSAFLNEFSNK